MLQLGQPDFSMVESHNHYVRNWKLAILERVHQLYGLNGEVRPCVYICGYNYDSNRYEEVVSPVQLYIMQNPTEKFNLYVFLKNIERQVPFQPLGMVLTTNATIYDNDQAVSVIAVLCQSRLTFNRYVFIAEDDMVEDKDGGLQLKKVLKHNKRYESIYIGEEVALFESVFCLDITRN